MEQSIVDSFVEVVEAAPLRLVVHEDDAPLLQRARHRQELQQRLDLFLGLHVDDDQVDRTVGEDAVVQRVRNADVGRPHDGLPIDACPRQVRMHCRVCYPDRASFHWGIRQNRVLHCGRRNVF